MKSTFEFSQGEKFDFFKMIREKMTSGSKLLGSAGSESGSGYLDRAFRRTQRRLRHENVRVNKVMTCKIKRLMFELLKRVEKNPRKYQKKIEKAFHDRLKNLQIWRSDRFFSGSSVSFTLDEMVNREFEAQFQKVLLDHNYDQRLRNVLGFEKAYFRGYIVNHDGVGVCGIIFVGVDICW